MYCGDETGAFVGDVGGRTARFGYGGEDCPKVVVPSAVYARAPSNNDAGGGAGGDAPRGRRPRWYSAPVSLTRLPPEDCFPSGDGGEAEGGGGEAGFVPIYRSLNSNDQSNRRGGGGKFADDGLIRDMDAWEAAWEYSYGALCVRGRGKHTAGHKFREGPESPPEGTTSRSQTTSWKSQAEGGLIDHPLLAVDSTSRTLPAREQEKQRALMLETLFERLSAPAAYIAPSPMLASFAYGRQTSLVVDVGHSGSRVTPLVDGHCLDAGSVGSGRGGGWLADVQRGALEGGRNAIGNGNGSGNESAAGGWNGWGDGKDEAGLPPCREEGIVPRYLLHPHAEKCPRIKLELLRRSSFHSWAVHEVMHEMMTSPHVLPLERRGEEEAAPFCGYGGAETKAESDVAAMEEDKKEEEEEDRSCYVLPDGTRVDLARSLAGRDLCRLPELLFSETLPSFARPPAAEDSVERPGGMLPLQKLIHKSLSEILDADLRKELSSNIVLVGGASLFPGFDRRLSSELGGVLPGAYKFKVIASKNSAETWHAAWIGGSILSSLGSFQQLWLSKNEYDECGAVLGLQRFKN